MMNRVSGIVLAAAFCLGTTAMFSNNARTAKIPGTTEMRFASDAAFRDGLYLGKLAAQNRAASRPAIDRWSRQQDRASFVAGYRQGYGESIDNSQPR